MFFQGILRRGPMPSRLRKHPFLPRQCRNLCDRARDQDGRCSCARLRQHDRDDFRRRPSFDDVIASVGQIEKTLNGGNRVTLDGAVFLPTRRPSCDTEVIKSWLPPKRVTNLRLGSRRPGLDELIEGGGTPPTPDIIRVVWKVSVLGSKNVAMDGLATASDGSSGPGENSSGNVRRWSDHRARMLVRPVEHRHSNLIRPFSS